MKKILVTGAAGFIGYHFSKRMVSEGYIVVGLDIINDYYDVNLKCARLKQLGILKDSIKINVICKSETYDNFSFIKMDICDKDALSNLFQEQKFNWVVNLAAQAGVRYSITNPDVYIQSNIVGFLNILECCRHNNIEHLAYASSSSVYGMNEKQPLSTSDNVDHPVALYAATKKNNELMAHAYSNLYGIPTTGLRFFTVYGPWGRPDMALFIFVKAILKNKTIDVYNNGDMIRDFTFIDDIVEGVKRVIEHPAEPDISWSGESPNPHSSKVPYKVYNIGNNNPVQLLDFIKAIENNLGKKSKKNFMSLQPGDVVATSADVEDLMDELGYKPNTNIVEGIDRFVKWYLDYYNY